MASGPRLINLPSIAMETLYFLIEFRIQSWGGTFSTLGKLHVPPKAFTRSLALCYSNILIFHLFHSNHSLKSLPERKDYHYFKLAGMH